MIHRIVISVCSFLLLAGFVSAEEVKLKGTVTAVNSKSQVLFLKVIEDETRGSALDKSAKGSGSDFYRFRSIPFDKAEIVGKDGKKLETVPDTWESKAAEIEVTFKREGKKLTMDRIKCLKFTK